MARVLRDFLNFVDVLKRTSDLITITESVDSNSDTDDITFSDVCKKTYVKVQILVI